jgi:hypothetical protein
VPDKNFLELKIHIGDEPVFVTTNVENYEVSNEVSIAHG